MPSVLRIRQAFQQLEADAGHSASRKAEEQRAHVHCTMLLDLAERDAVAKGKDTLARLEAVAA